MALGPRGHHQLLVWPEVVVRPLEIHSQEPEAAVPQPGMAFLLTGRGAWECLRQGASEHARDGVCICSPVAPLPDSHSSLDACSVAGQGGSQELCFGSRSGR